MCAVSQLFEPLHQPVSGHSGNRWRADKSNVRFTASWYRALALRVLFGAHLLSRLLLQISPVQLKPDADRHLPDFHFPVDCTQVGFGVGRAELTKWLRYLLSVPRETHDLSFWNGQVFP